jgi:hypothetical protein
MSGEELAVVAAVVAAEDVGDDPNDAAMTAVSSLADDRTRLNTVLQRLDAAGYLDVALNRGDGRLLSTHVRRALPRGVDAVRSARSTGATLTVQELRVLEQILHELVVLRESDRCGWQLMTRQTLMPRSRP